MKKFITICYLIYFLLAFTNVAGIQKNLSQEVVNTDSLKIHLVKSGEHLYKIANQYMSDTEFLFFNEFLEEIKSANNIGENNLIHSGQKLIIPTKSINSAGSQPETGKKISHSDLKGIYLNTYALTPSRLEKIVGKFDSLDYNTLTLDFKNTNGKILYPTKNKIALENGAREAVIRYPKKLISFLHSHNISLIARITIFKDTTMAAAYPNWCPVPRQDTTQIDSIEIDSTTALSKIEWCNPNSAAVQAYNLAIIEEVIELGVDEIQLDYVRFPTETGLLHADFGIPDSVARADVITDFVKKVHELTKKKRIKLSADIFGIVILQNREDVRNTGQDITKLEIYLDRIHPMIYPSHFSDNFWGKQEPYKQPYYFIYRICESLKGEVQHPEKIIPYLEGFTLNAKNANVFSIIAQIQAFLDSGLSKSYLFWNANTNYDPLWKAEKLRQKGDKYFDFRRE